MSTYCETSRKTTNIAQHMINIYKCSTKITKYYLGIINLDFFRTNIHNNIQKKKSIFNVSLSPGGCLLTIITVGGPWAHRPPYGPIVAHEGQWGSTKTC